VKLGYNKRLVAGKIDLLEPGVHYNQGSLCIIHVFGTEKIVFYNWMFVLTEFDCI
jgi:hypothetical protein